MTDAIQKAREALARTRSLVLEHGSAAQKKANGQRDYRKFSTIRQEMLTTIDAALAALDAETEVKVRGLEWSDEPKDGGDPTGRREGDAFVVWTTDGSLYRLKERRATDRTSYSCTIWRADTPISSHGDFREAKAAAQADFERRIRSALVTSEARS